MKKIIKYLGSQIIKSNFPKNTPRQGRIQEEGGQFGPIFINSTSRAKLHNCFKLLTVKIGL